jgi:hypothetical protein
MSETEISKLSTKDGSAQEMLRQFREKFRYREKAFNRAGKNVYSPALEKMEDYYDRNGERSPEKMTVHQIRSELFHIQEFFKSKTGDVKGAREVMREQDIRIFGENARGNPAKRMTIEERTKFWSVYEEFLSTYKNAEAVYGSEKIQQYLGSLTIGNRRVSAFRKGSIGLMDQLSTLDKMLRESGEEDVIEMRNVRQGR